MKLAREDAIKRMVMMRMINRFNDNNFGEKPDHIGHNPFSLNNEESPLIKDFAANDKNAVDIRSIGLKWKVCIL